MGTVREGLDRLQEAAATGALRRLCEEHAILLVVVFGSAMDQAAESPADLDIAVVPGPSASDLMTVTNAFIDMTRCSAVDVMDLSRAGVVARARALGPDCLPLYEAERGRFALAQMAALTEEMETAYLRRLDLELLAERA